MQKTARPISDFMTPMPYTIESDETLVKARALMREFNIRHLPVRSEYKIIGMLPLQVIDSIAAHSPQDFSKKIVQDAVVPNPYLVGPDTPLDQVASHMAKQKISSALIVEKNGSLVGIFTDIDALHALTKLAQGL